ncbi:cleft lip and palate transmembrane protein 1-like protein [Vanessa atalanta]|uniref:cleft lip and palate transmembrane protein 1-like protein n=1 Tax=Vanessa atalanta TaxID=42275 RepID=UPI001FCD56A4|nr:cleft lip and palate transmembrane protein 1-like protein [Vanessa atalanta]
MKYISITLILSLIFAGYVINTIWTLAEIFIPPECSRGERCFSNYLASNPVQHLVLYTSVKEYPYRNGIYEASVNKVHTSLKFDYRNEATVVVTLKIPRKTRNNGTFYMHAVLLDEKRLYDDFIDIFRTESVHTLPLVTHIEPQAATFNLLQSNDEGKKQNTEKKLKPYSHIATVAPLAILTDNLNLPVHKIPAELYPYMRVRGEKFLPIIQHNVLKSRISHLQLLNSSTPEVNVTVTVAPATYGSLRLALHVRLALEQLHGLGFSNKDVDDVKGIFADTNLYLLSATVLIASCHLLFDFLAFKNDVSFWKRKRSLAGLSARTVIWRAFSQLVIFFYLLDEQTSLLVLVPAGISAVIEAWKVSVVLHVRVAREGWRLRVWRARADAAERSTARADREAMRYLSLLLYPLCGAGALYSLLYEPHRGWYSWALTSVVNGVYAFGFLLMLPQLFVNYRLRSVAALPWRAFMYKAFNTFIDDVFAFIITMPTAHRVACFRDDLVFLVYLYQRWLYPVDKTRTDTAASMDENPEELEPIKQKDD